jgi:poly-gamma-glutamate capsule biosynthesis protein CapA/YwtB (metallophosphatase superfamily)
MNARSPRKLAPIILSLLIAAGVYVVYLRQVNPADPAGEQASSSSSEPSDVRQNNKIVIMGTGDMIAHDTVNQSALNQNGSYDYRKLTKGVKGAFTGADVRFCNQATPAGGDSYGISGYPVFNAPLEFIDAFDEMGCNMVNIGTNHTNDKGKSLIDASVAAWDDKSGVLVSGANRSQEEQDKPRFTEAKGVKIGFVSYTTYVNTPHDNPYSINMYSKDLMTKHVDNLKKSGAEVIVASMRWGVEYSSDVTARQRQISQELADSGVNVVFGHGPHVLAPVEKLTGASGGETVVWYSLGNLLSSQININELIGGFAKVEIDPESKKITELSFTPTYMHYDWTPEAKSRQSESDLSSRTNLRLVMLSDATELLEKSVHNTTASQQQSYVHSVLNKLTDVKISN